jgi:hypothetical protein
MLQYKKFWMSCRRGKVVGKRRVKAGKGKEEKRKSSVWLLAVAVMA